jgi:hypothetical protein
MRSWYNSVPTTSQTDHEQAIVLRPGGGLLGAAARHASVVVPGHGAVAEGPEVAARLAADHVYTDALRRGQEPADARLGPDWLPIHQSNLEQAHRGR